MNTSKYAHGYALGVIHQVMGDRDMLSALGALGSADERRGFRDGYHHTERSENRSDRIEDSETAA